MKTTSTFVIWLLLITSHYVIEQSSFRNKKNVSISFSKAIYEITTSYSHNQYSLQT